MLGLWGVTASCASGIITVMEKEYGKLTAEQFQELIGTLPAVFELMRKMIEHLESIPAAKFDELMTGDYGQYGYVYESPFAEHLAVVTLALNRQDEIREMATSPDPQEAVLAMVRARDDVEDKPHNEMFDRSGVSALVYSLGRTMQSMATYGRSISSLLQDVRDHNDQDSLFKAIRMDRTVIGCPSVLKIIARSQIRNNKAFFKHLRAALAGPSKKPMVALDWMRYAFLVLRELGINNLSERELEHLMVDKLGVYAKSSSSGKNLIAQYQRSKKMPTI